VAIPIPEPWGLELRDYRKQFGDPLADFIPAHVTLLPPTTVDDSVVAEAQQHLAAVAAGIAPFDMHLRGTGSFLPVSPVVFVTVVGGISDCERLEQRVRSGSLERELQFPYHPHVTVAHDLPAESLTRAFEELVAYEARFGVTAFHLYEHGVDGVWRSQQEFTLNG
jgi:2'-5' RNA ligase